ncbi:BlaI/MecI/CopY family transcriptional regulator [Planctomyces sp. SH-PL14]|uniref:BlaI/MecI/CopY family transcriptional regulator n=1 Tax=Planctomyces sp. SH-PL14 TaxID=1632864 RepID=UPI00078D849E|nr:BlaI/MecI/CopY family transcriptional regulator [Planctomyces sp. SH-PL14]AMV20039.1 Methicillin resistance regulatory protein MecI [Planctomyces sp. SH-PL14]
MSRPDDLPALSEAQWEIMNLVWDRGECSVADVWKVLQERRGVARNTVQTLMIRLKEKGWLSAREVDGAFLFTPTVSRDCSQQSTVQRLIETVFNGSAEGLVLSLLHGGALSTGEVERLRRLIASSRKKES